MNLTHTCIITDDVQRLRDFYRTLLGIEAKEYTEHYVEFPMEHVTLSLYSLTEHEGWAQLWRHRTKALCWSSKWMTSIPNTTG